MCAYVCYSAGEALAQTHRQTGAAATRLTGSLEHTHKHAHKHWLHLLNARARGFSSFISYSLAARIDPPEQASRNTALTSHRHQDRLSALDNENETAKARQRKRKRERRGRVETESEKA